MFLSLPNKIIFLTSILHISISFFHENSTLFVFSFYITKNEHWQSLNKTWMSDACPILHDDVTPAIKPLVDKMNEAECNVVGVEYHKRVRRWKDIFLSFVFRLLRLCSLAYSILFICDSLFSSFSFVGCVQ